MVKSRFSGENPTTLWVCASHQRVIRIVEDHGVHPDIKYISPGSALMGSQFNKIVLDDVYGDSESSQQDDKIKDWLDYSVRCRLAPGGEWQDLSA